MHKIIGRMITVVLFASVGQLAAGVENQAAEEHPMLITIDDTAVSVRAGDRLVLRYRYQNVPFKPYVEQLFTPHGINTVRDAPHDHLHHHGLMFAVAVNGVNFWEETGAAGRQAHRSFADVRIGACNDLPCAGFTEYITWINPRSQELLLTERRTIEVSCAKDLGASLLTWQACFDPPPEKTSFTLTGHHYFGLGMRFLESMDAAGQFLNGGTDSVEVVRGDERNFRSTWCAYAAEADGKPVTVAVFDCPDNPRHPATWFTMTRPFAYLSATLNLHKKPLAVASESPLALRYGVALWDGRVEAGRIERLYRSWVSSGPPETAGSPTFRGVQSR